jgi:spore germination cell wall hydrolase CwlJ-like protein
MSLSSLACLALAIYMESRGEPEQGQVAVGYTVINRVEQARYPTKVCTIVGSGEYTWPKKAQPSDKEALERCKKVAENILKRRVKDPTQGATHFHSRKVKPPWTKSMVKTTSIGHHIFYKKAKCQT